MDRNTILAVLLSIIVILVFQQFFFPKPPPRPEPSEVADTTGVAQNPAPALTQAQTEERQPPPPPVTANTGFSDSGEERMLVFESPLLRAGFSSRGGQLVSLELPQFENPFGGPVELVSTGASEFGMVLETETGLVDLDNVIFDAREESLADGGRRFVFEANRAGARIRKSFTLRPDDYLVDLQVQVEGMTDVSAYRMGWTGGIPRAEKNPKTYKQSLAAIVLLGKNKETLKADKFKDEPTRELEGTVRWAGVRNKYFTAIVAPPAESSSRVLASGNNDQMRVGAELIMSVLQGRSLHDFEVYVGPLDYDLLKEHDLGFEAAVDLGWKVFRPISLLLLTAMTWLYKIVPNYGWVIIIISIVTKVLFYPLTKSSLKSMRAMQKLQPEITKLREKYKNDNQRMQTEMMALYKEHKVNPVGGCLPILLQMPVFIALYQVLSNSIAMRNAPFLAWITDLSTPDTIAVVGGFAIHILPIILFGFTVLQQIWTPVADPRQKMMGYMMPIVTLFIFYGFPAGLNLYWTVNSIMTVAQQWWIHREDPTRAVPKASTA